MNLNYLLPFSRTQVPPTPDAQEARETAHAELSKHAYSHQPGLWSRFWTWLSQHLRAPAGMDSAPTWISSLIIVIAVAILLLTLIILGRHISLSRRKYTSSPLFTDTRNSAALLNSANDAASNLDWTTSVLERFRALIRRLDECDLIEDYPGMTAHEAANLAAAALKEIGTDFVTAANLFDALRYSTLTATAAHNQWMQTLDLRVTQLITTATAKNTKKRADNNGADVSTAPAADPYSRKYYGNKQPAGNNE